MHKVIHIVGARPNFMKAAPVIQALKDHGGFEQLLVHTGQHYDRNMSDVFFDQLGMPKPDINLGVGSGSHAEQTARVMVDFEKILNENPTDLLIVYGDVNSTIATALVASKMGVKIAHVEAGLRSFDRGMPEEINRILTDRISDFYFTPSEDGDAHLLSEGVSKDKIFLVGNVMIDTLVRLLPQATRPNEVKIEDRYALFTLHRPSNVDDPEMLANLVDCISELSRDLQVVFPIHPRTRQRMVDCGIKVKEGSNVTFIDPVGYLEFMWLQKNAVVVVTDSGGVQEETTYLGVPCVTVRENTERPVTISQGTNQLVGQDVPALMEAVQKILNESQSESRCPELWDGKASVRVAEVLGRLL